MFILAGQSAIPFPLYSIDSSPVTGASDTSGTNYSIYFRDFDRTTDTGGIFNDAALEALTEGYGAFYHVQAFIDVNDDMTLTPEDPRSNIYYYGDNDGDTDGAPDWGGDWDDLISPSFITQNMDFTSFTLTIPAP